MEKSVVKYQGSADRLEEEMQSAADLIGGETLNNAPEKSWGRHNCSRATTDDMKLRFDIYIPSSSSTSEQICTVLSRGGVLPGRCGSAASERPEQEEEVDSRSSFTAPAVNSVGEPLQGVKKRHPDACVLLRRRRSEWLQRLPGKICFASELHEEAKHSLRSEERRSDEGSSSSDVMQAL
ncbi:hypothetical protein INR49_014177 [Caranx melampygus]|nr:hypothetical protein INR49_014177 [Caranx melampygus]